MALIAMFSPMRNKTILGILNCAAINRIAEPVRLASKSPTPGTRPRIGSSPMRIDVPGMVNRRSSSSAKKRATHNRCAARSLALLALTSGSIYRDQQLLSGNFLFAVFPFRVLLRASRRLVTVVDRGTIVGPVVFFFDHSSLHCATHCFDAT